MAKRTLIDEPLSVAPSLVGAALASPVRRGAALAVDLALLLVPTVATALLAAALSLAANDPRSLHAMRTLVSPPAGRPAAERAAFCDLVPLFVRTEAPGLPASAVAAAEEGRLEQACDAMQGYNIVVAVSFEGEIEKPPARTVVLPIHKLIPPGARVLALFGVPALYFIVCTTSRRGATIGKRLFGIRVARLDGERLSPLEALERFAGYVHIPATMFLGLADLWRDPNRRLAHDRTVHTAVFRVRRGDQFPPPGRNDRMRAEAGVRTPAPEPRPDPGIEERAPAHTTGASE